MNEAASSIVSACRLCFSNSDILLPIFNKSGEDAQRIAGIAEKYLKVKLTPEYGRCTNICVRCWTNLDNFHKFCNLVERKQRQMDERNNIADGASDFKSDNAENFTMAESPIELKATKSDKGKNEDIIESSLIEISEATGFAGESTGESSKDDNSDDFELEEFESRTDDEISWKEAYALTACGVPGRKIGRPAKRDASLCLNEDRLIASHTQLYCDQCQAEHKTFNELKKHFKESHGQDGYAVCCNKRLYKKGVLVDHIHLHKDPNYFKCDKCGNIFADRVCLRNHVLLKHQEDSNLPFACSQCPKKFAKIYFLQRHAVKHVTSEERAFVCNECNRRYPSLSRLNGHISYVHGSGGLKVCNHCGALVRGSSTFQKHMRMHEGIAERGVQCEVCGQWLTNKYVLRQHMELHDDPKTYRCNVCGKDAPSRVALVAHYRYHHANVEPTHKCGECGKAFKTSRGLREHVATHTGQSLYTCTYCPKTFKCSSNLHKHRKWQHPVEWTRDKQHTKGNFLETSERNKMNH